MRKLLFVLCIFIVKQSAAQYNNEWIDYSKTYYKFKIAVTGLYRINQPNLPASLTGTPAEHFQLWRNGKQVPLYTSVNSGALGSSGYIEFWGERNDGTADKPLYRIPAHQLSTKYSLETDTAVYFLTVNANAAQNLRFTNAVNNISNPSGLPSLSYFIHKASVHFKEYINKGKVYYAGEYVYSSAYDEGEWWGSYEINQGTTKKFAFSNLNVYAGGPAASFKINMAGTAPPGTRSGKEILGKVKEENFAVK